MSETREREREPTEQIVDYQKQMENLTMLQKIKQAFTKEDVQLSTKHYNCKECKTSNEVDFDPKILAHLPNDFYEKAFKWIITAPKREADEAKVLLYRLMRKRLGKLIAYGSVLHPEGYSSYLTKEEYEYCKEIQKTTSEFWRGFFAQG